MTGKEFHGDIHPGSARLRARLAQEVRGYRTFIDFAHAADVERTYGVGAYMVEGQDTIYRHGSPCVQCGRDVAIDAQGGVYCPDCHIQ